MRTMSIRSRVHPRQRRLRRMILVSEMVDSLVATRVVHRTGFLTNRCASAGTARECSAAEQTMDSRARAARLQS